MVRYLGIGSDRVSLFCHHLRTDDDGVHFEVINGAWNGRLKDGVVYTRYGPSDSAKPIKVLYNDTIPTQNARNYHDAIDYMNTVLARGQAYTWSKAYMNRALYHVNRFTRRVKEAIRGMKQGWNFELPRPKNPRFSDMDDDIAF